MVHLITRSMDQLITRMKVHAESGLFSGKSIEHRLPYFDNARQQHYESGTSLIYTRDSGHHTSGWWKNPDYERCYHLSLSFWDFKHLAPRPFEHKQAKLWVQAFYGNWIRYIWEEGPAQKLDAEVRHYRVFCDLQWQPIIPRGEVYTREFIEAGWKSWSDQQYDLGRK